MSSQPARGPAFPAPDDIAGWDAARLAREAVALEASDQMVLALGVKVTEARLGGVPVLDVRPKDWPPNGRGCVVGVHGGAWVFYSARSTVGVAALVAQATASRVLWVDYTVAPRGRWPLPVDEVSAVTRALLEQGAGWRDIALFGDSAGANLVAAATLKMRDLGHGMPAALAMWSPCLDFANVGDTRATLQAADPLVCYEHRLERAMRAYAPEEDWEHPHVSPIHGDFGRGFPPCLIQAGTREILLSDAVRLYQAIEQGGGTAKLDVYEGMTHDFQAFMPHAAESKLALGKLGRFVARHLRLP